MVFFRRGERKGREIYYRSKSGQTWLIHAYKKCVPQLVFWPPSDWQMIPDPGEDLVLLTRDLPA